MYNRNEFINIYSKLLKGNNFFQENIGSMARNLKALVTRRSFKERFKTAQSYLQKLKAIIDDVILDKKQLVNISKTISFFC